MKCHFNFSRKSAWIALFCAAVLASTAPVDAKVKRIVIDKSKSEPEAYGGKSFGTAGPYEKVEGTAYGELDPKDRRNAIIQDIQLAPRNSRGMVEYSVTFMLIKPVDMAKASGVLFYEVQNRGRKIDPGGSPAGHTYLMSGWQGEIPPATGPDDTVAETLHVPTAKNADGSSITGLVLGRIKNFSGNTAPLMVYTRAIPYLPATLDTKKASLTSRASEGIDGTSGPITKIPDTDWAWADCTKTPFPGTPDPAKICLKNGFDSALLYEIVFTAKDPLVLGIGFAATRDLVSFFRHAGKDDSGTANPVAGKITYSVSRGASQSGNYIRSFINLGFNEDESGKIVWDGAMPHIAGRQLPLNLRFGMPDGASDPYEPGSDAILWWSDWKDTVRGRKSAGLLDRCRVTNTCPKIFETFGSTEFWDLRMSPDLVGTTAAEDIPVPDNVRRYYFPGTTHGGGAGGFNPAPPAAARGRGGACMLPSNPNPESDSEKALTAAMVEWIEKGTQPPASAYPKLADGTLVPATKAATGFPSIPGLAFSDHFENPLIDYDWGPDFKYEDVSGIISKEPPVIRRALQLLVPKVNEDGNEIAGVPSVLHQAPLGTYLGWNIMAGGFFKGQMCEFTGGYVPFAKTKAERTASGDPRRSLEERYANQEAYVAAVRAAAEKAVRERYLLREDADRLIQQAAASNVLK
jgi:Alpha/beta hydrolase domain